MLNEPPRSDKRNGRESELVIRALADQEPLVPVEELIDDSRHSEPVVVESTRQLTIIEKPDSAAAVGLDGPSIDSSNQDESLLEARITVTATEEERPRRSIR
jgi:hypothetical protein